MIEKSQTITIPDRITNTHSRISIDANEERDDLQQKVNKTHWNKIVPKPKKKDAIKKDTLGIIEQLIAVL